MDQLNEPRIKGVADIVFVLDASWSMRLIIQSIKEYIGKFVETLLTDPQSTVKDLRLGLVTHDLSGKPGVYCVDFIEDYKVFQEALGSAPKGWDEFGLPALDRALDMEWREQCRRYIVFISDEPARKGRKAKLQLSKVNQLGMKFASMHVKFMGFNQKNCPAYSLLGKTPGSSFHVVSRNDLVGPNMREVLEGIAKTVSRGIDQELVGSVEKNLYGMVPTPGPWSKEFYVRVSGRIVKGEGYIIS